jgi:hypothetical protein
LPINARRVAARIKGATLTMYPGMGHDFPPALLPDWARHVSETAALKDFLDSLTLVELAIKIADLTNSNTLFERHDFFVAQTVQDLIDVTDKDLRGEA